MTISELIQAVKEPNLSKQQLESYRDDLAGLSATLSLEMAELEKKQALFLDASQEDSVAGASRRWNALPQGLRMIEIKHSLRAVDKIYSSVKSRLYSLF